MYFPPLNCACLAIDYDRFQSLSRGVDQPTPDDTVAIYTLAHENYTPRNLSAQDLFAHIREQVELSAQAANAVNIGIATDAAIMNWRMRFATLQREIAEDATGYSAHDAIETQAVVEGLIGACAVPASAAELLAVAFDLYANSASEVYTRVLRRLACHGPDAAILLAPRLASFALGFDDPGSVLAEKLDALDKSEVVSALVATTPTVAPHVLLDALLKDSFDLVRLHRPISAKANFERFMYPISPPAARCAPTWRDCESSGMRRMPTPQHLTLVAAS